MRNYTWSKTHNLIFIDNPVGTGFSFTDSDAGYAKNEIDVGRNLHEAMQQLYELFDWSSSSGFWITGESYAGKYVPALAYQIYKSKNARVEIPLKGVAIGNFSLFYLFYIQKKSICNIYINRQWTFGPHSSIEIWRLSLSAGTYR